MARLTRIAPAALALALLAVTPAAAVAPPLSDPKIVAHLDLAAGQNAENIALEPDGSADLTFIGARQVARVGLDGAVDILATLPTPTNPDTPTVHIAAATGLARAHDGTLYLGYATGDELAGLWRLSPGGTPVQVASIPASLVNGVALDEHAGIAYVAESATGAVWRVPLDGGAPTLWASGPDLAPTTFIGANGIKLHHGAVWVSNTDRGTVLRIPVCPDGSAGPVETRYTDLAGIDDFAFTGHHGDTLLAALNATNEVAYVTEDGGHTIVLTAADGLSNPTSIALRGNRVYVPSAALFTGADPNLLTATYSRSF